MCICAGLALHSCWPPFVPTSTSCHTHQLSSKSTMINFPFITRMSCLLCNSLFTDCHSPSVRGHLIWESSCPYLSDLTSSKKKILWIPSSPSAQLSILRIGLEMTSNTTPKDSSLKIGTFYVHTLEFWFLKIKSKLPF